LDGEFYQFIAGGWDDFDALEPAKLTITENKSRHTKATNTRNIFEGRRDDALYNQGRNIIGTFLPPVSGNDGGQIEKSLERACKKFTKHLLGWNQVKCNPPLADKEVIYKAKNLWKRKLEGSLYEDGRRMISLPDDEKFMGLARTSPGALALLFQLRQRFMPFKEFTAPQSRSKEFGISPKTFGNDMQLLVNNGFLYRRHKGGRFSTSFAIAHKINNGHGDANIYILAMP
jgi:hypothetical protein